MNVFAIERLCHLIVCATLVKYTAWSNIQLGQIYSLVKYTPWSNIHRGQIYTLVKYNSLGGKPPWAQNHPGLKTTLVLKPPWSQNHLNERFGHRNERFCHSNERFGYIIFI